MKTIDKRLPLIPLREVVIFPNSILPLMIARAFSKKAFYESVENYDNLAVFVTQKKGYVEIPQKKDFYNIGTIGKILQYFEGQDNTIRCIVEGVERVKIHTIEKDLTQIKNSSKFCFFSVHSLYPVKSENSKEERTIGRIVKESFQELLNLERFIPDELLPSIFGQEEPKNYGYIIAGHLPIESAIKQELLEKEKLSDFLRELHRVLVHEIEFRKLKDKIEESVKEEIRKGQKQFFLHEQMKQIQKELGEDFSDEFCQLQTAIEKAEMPEEIRKKAEKELLRLKNTPSLSPEAGVIRTYLDWLISLPWNKRTEDKLDLKLVQKILDEDHYGLEEPKNRILEYLAVLKLKGKLRGQILCFVGPPGVGKTSLAKSIARSLGRKFVRMSLGGIRDEAEIRGHRRTYVGALPGRIIQGIKRAGSKNPVFLLDEIDKVGMDFRGDPYASLMEVLDPEVNRNFQDHYLEVDFDLSEVLFITTANTVHTIPLALRDRMEIIRLPGYLDDEKFHIAVKHLIPKLLIEASLDKIYFKIHESAIYKIIHRYTKEAGVRELERQLGKLIRISAKNYVDKKQGMVFTQKNIEKFLGAPIFSHREGEKTLAPGVAYGLAWTETGGEILKIEVLILEGKGNLILTGQLGDVLKESAYAALSYIRSRFYILGIPKDFYEKKDIHLHIPEGSIPKDGPSAGVAILCAMISAFISKSLSSELAMMGEITLSGEILKVGGLQEKISAAKRGKIKSIILPEDNKAEVLKIRKTLKKGIKFLYVEHMDNVLHIVFPEISISKRYKTEGSVQVAGS